MLKSESERDWNRLLSTDILVQVKSFLLQNFGAEVVIIFNHEKESYYAFLQNVEIENNHEDDVFDEENGVKTKHYPFGQSHLIKFLNKYWLEGTGESVFIKRDELYSAIKNNTERSLDLKNNPEPLRKLLNLGVIRKHENTVKKLGKEKVEVSFEILPIIQHIFLNEALNLHANEESLQEEFEQEEVFENEQETTIESQIASLEVLRNKLDWKYITAFKALAKGQFIAKNNAGKAIYETIAKKADLMRESFAQIGYKAIIPDRLLIDRYRMFQELSVIESMTEEDFEALCRLKYPEILQGGEGKDVVLVQDNIFFCSILCEYL